MYEQAERERGGGEGGGEYSRRKKKTKMALENNINKLISTHVMNGDIQFIRCLWFSNVIKFFIEVLSAMTVIGFFSHKCWGSQHMDELS
jgi:hypothetical protein